MWVKWVHIAEHEDALAKQKAQAQTQMLQQGQPPQQQQAPGMVQSSQTGNTPKFGQERSNPLQAASPLKQEAKTPINSMTNKQ